MVVVDDVVVDVDSVKARVIMETMMMMWNQKLMVVAVAVMVATTAMRRCW